jgi:hypothetical protein
VTTQMCQLVMLGAHTEPYRLRDVFSASTHDFDTDVAPDAWCLAHFSATDSVVCVTLNGCSCALLTEPLDGNPGSSQQRTTPAYAFRRAPAEAALRFRSVRLLTWRDSRPAAQAAPITRRTTTLGQFLRSKQIETDVLLRIIG